MSIEAIFQADLALQKKKLSQLKEWNSPEELIISQEELITALEQSLKALLLELGKVVES